MLRLSCALFLFVLAACKGNDVPRTPEEVCRSGCEARAKQCSDDDCAIGCNLSLDRLIERETDHVLACVARAKDCNDARWAECATLVGAHADGGPAAPPPPEE